MFHLEKLKDLTSPFEYVVTVSNRFRALDILEDPVDLLDTFKCETLEAGKECIGERPRSRSGFDSVETLDSIEKNRAAILARNRDHYSVLLYRTRSLLRRGKERYVKGLVEDVGCHLNTYRALKSTFQMGAIRTKDVCLMLDADGQMARWA